FLGLQRYKLFRLFLEKNYFFSPYFKYSFERLTLSLSGCKYTNFNFLIPNKSEKKLSFFSSLFLQLDL
ncbi:hypothetical protein, partial [Lutibacter sp.]|uniref:hypothetical protein n=1 Tax=Lutibacter sp. TaxID=1925666 RepID=UPI0025C582F1